MIPKGSNVFVLFAGRNRSYWTDWFNPQGYRHCMAFWFDPKLDKWIVTEALAEGFTFLYLSPDEFDRWIAIMTRANCTCVKVEKKDSSSFYFRMGLWCAPYVAHLVGSKSRAWRPIGLLRDLLREGATAAFIPSSKANPKNDESKSPTRKSRSKSYKSC